MTGLVRKATLLAVCGLLAASAAMASVPSPANSDKPSCFGLVGSNTGTIDPAGEFCVTVRDLANLPINNSLVVVDLSGCSGLYICDNNEMGLTVDCGTQTVRGFTGAGGVICFRIKGYANNGPFGDTSPVNPFNCAKIYADGVLLNSPSVYAYDHDGNGLLINDLSPQLGDFFGASNPASRSDINCDGANLPNDWSLFLDVYFLDGSIENCLAGGGTTGKDTCPLIP